MHVSKLTLSIVQKCLDYDPETGVFTWKTHSRRMSIGEEAGSISSNGRRYISVCGEKHLAHRLAWFYVYGVWPDNNISPKNGDYDDVRIDNLQELTPSEVARKASVRSSNRSGFRGVSWSATKGKWVAVLNKDYKRYHLGYFDTAEEASSVYESALENLPEGSEGSQVIGSELIIRRRRQRNHWLQMLAENNDDSGWVGIDQFIRDIGEPRPGHKVVAEDKSMMVGPGNFRWEKAAGEWKSKKPRYWRDKKLLRQFGLTPEQYQEMWDNQSGLCAICEKPETMMRKGLVRMLVVDHNHTTGAVRALLCNSCNVGVGMLGDDIKNIQKAAAYLRKHLK